MIGPYLNLATVVVGSSTGAFLGDRISQNLRTRLPMVFGLSAMGLGIATIIRVKYFPAVILALLVGTTLGELLHLEDWIIKLSTHTRTLVDRIAKPRNQALSHEEFLNQFVAILVLICSSGTGIFGTMNEAMTGDTSLIIVKSVLDLFSVGIFATALGYSLVAVAIPNFLIQVALFFLSIWILPLVSPAMIADFSAAGGLIMVATGFRIAGIKHFHVANMLPALLLIMPISFLWARYLVH
ncbi:DUF554 domain-containing protein [Geothrix sp. 21YS21S-2]|uniref:DUF554 domain-containing protein n=1 Tax=Geothrix sp. 21YS21S-2 TaxID=3068893 RepID=UPI0027BAC94F|nr:DUF554 domain-containing protein [Geothrix sp. 21YS21S-2]